MQRLFVVNKHFLLWSWRYLILCVAGAVFYSWYISPLEMFPCTRTICARVIQTLADDCLRFCWTLTANNRATMVLVDGFCHAMLFGPAHVYAWRTTHICMSLHVVTSFTARIQHGRETNHHTFLPAQQWLGICMSSVTQEDYTLPY